MGKVLIEFNWRGETIKQFIDKERLFNDIKEVDDFWGKFTSRGQTFEYQIHWNGVIYIFDENGVDEIDVVNNFNLSFSKNY